MICEVADKSLEDIERGRAEIIRQYGEWTAHNIHLGQGLYTLGADRPYHKLRRIVQVVGDVMARPISELRILDLACLEGGFAIEFARHGAEVLGIEGREANLAKARFAREVLGLNRLRFEQGDVRDLSRDRHGMFDVVVCAGILYHLDAPDVFRFVDQIADVCRQLLVVDTSVSLRSHETRTHQGRDYRGCSFPEWDQETTEDQRSTMLWSSLDNPTSFWLTKPSLLNLLAHAGFTTVMEIHNPSLVGQLSDRVMLAAIKGSPCQIHSTPSTNATPPDDWPESASRLYDPMQRSTYRLEKKLTHLVPCSVRNAVKSTLRSMGLRRSAAPWEWSMPWKKR